MKRTLAPPAITDDAPPLVFPDVEVDDKTKTFLITTTDETNDYEEWVRKILFYSIGFTPVFKIQAINKHSRAALERKISEHCIHTKCLQLGYETALDAGGNPRRNHQMSQRFDRLKTWSCVPRTRGNSSAAVEDMFRYMKFIDYFDEVGEEPPMCQHYVHSCECIRPDVVISIHSYYYIKPYELAAAIADTKSNRAYVAIHVVDENTTSLHSGRTQISCSEYPTVKMDFGGNTVPYTGCSMEYLRKTNYLNLDGQYALCWTLFKEVGDTLVYLFTIDEIGLEGPEVEGLDHNEINEIVCPKHNDNENPPVPGGPRESGPVPPEPNDNGNEKEDGISRDDVVNELAGKITFSPNQSHDVLKKQFTTATTLSKRAKIKDVNEVKEIYLEALDLSRNVESDIRDEIVVRTTDHDSFGNRVRTTLRLNPQPDVKNYYQSVPKWFNSNLKDAGLTRSFLTSIPSKIGSTILSFKKLSPPKALFLAIAVSTVIRQIHKILPVPGIAQLANNLNRQMLQYASLFMALCSPGNHLKTVSYVQEMNTTQSLSDSLSQLSDQ